jgi:Tol biopolymer transport system component
MFSPDGTRIAYWSREAAGLPASLWVMAADGSKRRNLTGTTNVSSSESLQAAWSPDSRQLAFSVGDYYASTQLWVVGSDGANLHSLGGGTLARSDPAWSPDSRVIAFRGHTTGVLPDAVPADPAIGVYVIAADGTGELRVSAAPRAGGAPNNVSFGGPHVGTAPSWSPDGKSLLFAFGATGHHALAIGAADGSSEHLINLPAGDHLLPVFSPDGLQVAFVDYSGTGEDARAFVAAIDGSGLRPLHGGDPVAFNPLFWSPDGRFVVTYSVDLTAIDLSPAEGAEAGNTAAPVSIALGTATADGFPERTTWQRLAP